MIKEFYDSETASSSGLSHFPGQPTSIPSPIGLVSRDSCLQAGTRNLLGTTGHVFEDLLARDEPSSALFGNSKNWHRLLADPCPTDTGRIAERARLLERPSKLYNTKNQDGCFRSCEKFVKKLDVGAPNVGKLVKKIEMNAPMVGKV